MKRTRIPILVVFILWLPAMTCADNSIFLSPTNSFSREWYIVAKIPSAEGLAIGVFLFQEGMPKEQIFFKFGKPQETILLGMDEGGRCHGSILLYPNHYFFLSGDENLLTIKNRPTDKGISP